MDQILLMNIALFGSISEISIPLILRLNFSLETLIIADIKIKNWVVIPYTLVDIGILIPLFLTLNYLTTHLLDTYSLGSTIKWRIPFILS